MVKRCASCEFFSGERKPLDDKIGECRRWPPAAPKSMRNGITGETQVGARAKYPRWPSSTHECGEWKPFSDFLFPEEATV